MFDFGGSSQQIVGIAVTSNMGVEVAVVDKKTNIIAKYGQRHIEYDSAKREIEDYSAFKSAIIEIFGELGIEKKTRPNVYVVLPNVHFGFIDLPAEIDEDDINSVLLAKAEESYIFKKSEPVISYSNASMTTASENKYLVYSAIQRDAVDNITDILTELGCNLIGIEGAFSAIFRGIDFVRIADDVISSKSNWNLLLVGSNSYSLFALAGNNIFDYVEVPVAIKSLSYEEAYHAIASSVAQNLPNYPAKKLLIVSNTDDISAEVLRTQIRFEEDVETLDCNKYSKKPYVEVSSLVHSDEARFISLSVIGAGTYQASNIAFTLNILGKISATSAITLTILGNEVVITPQFANSILAVAGLSLAFIFALTWFGLTTINKDMSEKIESLEDQKVLIAKEMETAKPAEVAVNINSLIANIITNNKKLISYYDSLSMDIPKDIWLTYFYGREGDNVSIEGLALGINEIYEYYKGIKNSIPTSTVRLNRLRALTDLMNNTYDPNAKNESKLYDFEISNTLSKRMGGGIKDPEAATSEGAEEDAFGPPAPGGNGAPSLEPINDVPTN